MLNRNLLKKELAMLFIGLCCLWFIAFLDLGFRKAGCTGPSGSTAGLQLDPNSFRSPDFMSPFAVFGWYIIQISLDFIACLLGVWGPISVHPGCSGMWLELKSWWGQRAEMLDKCRPLRRLILPTRRLDRGERLSRKAQLEDTCLRLEDAVACLREQVQFLSQEADDACQELDSLREQPSRVNHLCQVLRQAFQVVLRHV